MTSQLDSREFEKVTTAGRKVSRRYFCRVDARLNGCCNVNTSCSDVHAASQQGDATDARDDVYVPYHTSGPLSDAKQKMETYRNDAFSGGVSTTWKPSVFKHAVHLSGSTVLAGGSISGLRLVAMRACRFNR